MFSKWYIHEKGQAALYYSKFTGKCTSFAASKIITSLIAMFEERQVSYSQCKQENDGGRLSGQKLYQPGARSQPKRKHRWANYLYKYWLRACLVM